MLPSRRVLYSRGMIGAGRYRGRAVGEGVGGDDIDYLIDVVIDELRELGIRPNRQVMEQVYQLLERGMTAEEVAQHIAGQRPSGGTGSPGGTESRRRWRTPLREGRI